MCLNTGGKLPLTRAPSLALSPSEPDFLPLSKLPCRPDLRKAPAKRRRMTPDVTWRDPVWPRVGRCRCQKSRLGATGWVSRAVVNHWRRTGKGANVCANVCECLCVRMFVCVCLGLLVFCFVWFCFFFLFDCFFLLRLFVCFLSFVRAFVFSSRIFVSLFVSLSVLEYLFVCSSDFVSLREYKFLFMSFCLFVRTFIDWLVLCVFVYLSILF